MTFCTTAFERLARTTARGLGVPELPLVVLPHPVATLSVASLETLVAGAMSDILRGLTKEKSR